MNVRSMQAKHFAVSAFAAGLLLAAGATQAANSANAGNRSAIQAQYTQDVANCKNGSTQQEKSACMREAGAAREEALRQNLSAGDPNQLQQNALARCGSLPETARQDCVTQMTSPDTLVRGSVQGGGVLRETEIAVPAGTPGSMPMPNGSPGYAPAGTQGYAPAGSQGYAPPAAPGSVPMR